MKNIGAHPLHINKISDGDKSNISEDSSDSKEKRTVSSKDADLPSLSVWPGDSRYATDSPALTVHQISR